MLDKRQNFTTKTKKLEWEDARHCCRACFASVADYRYGEYDHIIPASVGGDNSLKNCKLLCRPCHARKTKRDRKEIDKTRRIIKARLEPKAKVTWPTSPMPGTKASGWKKPMNGKAHRRD